MNLYNANDGVLGRDGGPYADQADAELVGRQRALAEGREYTEEDGKMPCAATPLVSAEQLLTMNSYSATPAEITLAEDIVATPIVAVAAEITNESTTEVTLEESLELGDL